MKFVKFLLFVMLACAAFAMTFANDGATAAHAAEPAAGGSCYDDHDCERGQKCIDGVCTSSN